MSMTIASTVFLALTRLAALLDLSELRVRTSRRQKTYRIRGGEEPIGRSRVRGASVHTHMGKSIGDARSPSDWMTAAPHEAGSLS
jgi:hypothetical protein